MRKINESQITSTSAMFYKQGTWTHLQKAYIEPISEIVKSLITNQGGVDTDKTYVLSGCINSGSGSTYNISEGAVFYNNEIFLVDATTFTVTTGTAVATIVTTQNTTDYNADPCLFSDGVYKDVHDIRKVVIAEGTSGSGISNYSQLHFSPFANNYEDISTSVTNGSGFTTVRKYIRKYADGTISVNFIGTYSGAKSANTIILSGLPKAIDNRYYVGSTLLSNTQADIQLYNQTSYSDVVVGVSGLGAGDTLVQFGFEYKMA